MLLEEWEATPLASPLGSVEEAGKSGDSWTRIEVPGNWQLHPAFADHEGYVLYRCRFGPVSPPEGGMLALRFRGIYYSARVWLNGEFLGSHEGYFAPFEFDCTDLVNESAENEVLVEVCSPNEPDENDRNTVGGVWSRWDGMDPTVNPGGIFRPVEVISSGPVRVRLLRAEAHPSGNCRFVARVYSREARSITLKGVARPVGFEAPWTQFEKTLQLEPGETRMEMPFSLKEPRLWWTWDRGEQPLYELRLSGPEIERKTRFGVRSVELRGWNFYLNGERIFLRGTNYLPSDAYPARATEKLFRDDARLLRDTNLNAVRVHAHVAEKAFYDACDELGLLVLQDFPLQWTHHKRVLESAVEQAQEMTRLLRSHPSVGLYLAHDEPFYVVPPRKWTLLTLARTAVEVAAPHWMFWQRRVLDPAVVKAIREEDDSRPIIEAAGHPLTTNHLYFGWYYGEFRDLERAIRLFPGLSRFPTEYGAQALPEPESLAEIWPEGKDPDWKTLNARYCFQPRRMRRYVTWRGDWRAYIWESQDYQAELIKHATELFRVRKYHPTGGAFPFMFNDSAPAISWSVVDWRRRPKRAYAVLQAVMRPVIICARYPKKRYPAGEEMDLPIFVVNDLRRWLQETGWGWELRQDGDLIASDSGESHVPPDSVVEVGRVRARLSGTGRYELVLKLSGEQEASNRYEFRVG